MPRRDGLKVTTVEQIRREMIQLTAQIYRSAGVSYSWSELDSRFRVSLQSQDESGVIGLTIHNGSNYISIPLIESDLSLDLNGFTDKYLSKVAWELALREVPEEILSYWAY